MKVFEASWYSAPLRQPYQSLALALVSIICLFGSGYFYGMEKAFISRSQRVDGVVTGFVEKNNERMYSAVIEYSDGDGNRFRFVSTSSSSHPTMAIGDTVPVLYDRETHSKAKVDSFFQKWIFTFIFGVLGVAFFAGSVIAWVFRHQIYRLAGYPELSGPK